MTMIAGYWAKKVVAVNVVALDGTGDYDNIQDAIDDLPAEGGIVMMRPGTYVIDSEITINKDNVTIQGQGGATIIKLTDGYDSNIFMINVSGRSKILITNLTIDGNRANQTAGTMRGINLYNCSECIISNVWVTDLRTGNIYLDDSSNCAIVSCISTNSPGGINLMGNSSYNTISSNIIRNCTAGITMGATFTGVPTLNSVTSNTISSIDQDGIWISYCDYNTISNNVINNCSQQTNNAYSDIILRDGATYNIISDNIILENGTNKAKYGIREDSTSEDYNLVHGNIVIGPVTAAISTQGVNTVVADNITG